MPSTYSCNDNRDSLAAPQWNTNNGSTTEYNLALKFPTDYQRIDDPLTERDQVYELCFNGYFNEIGSMLTNIYAMECKQMFGHISRTLERASTTPDGMWPPEYSTDKTTATGSKHHDPHNCGWNDPSSGEMAEDPYNCGWGQTIVQSGILQSGESPTDPYDCSSDDLMDDQGVLQSGGSLADVYDCGWDDPMDDQGILQSGESEANADDCIWHSLMLHEPIVVCVAKSVEDPYDVGWDNDMNGTVASLDVMEGYCGMDASQDERSVGKDPYDCGWDAPEVGGQIVTGGDTANQFAYCSAEADQWPSSLPENELNVFEYAEHSMQCTIQILQNKRDDNFDLNGNTMVPPAGHVCDPMSTPTCITTQGCMKKYSEATNRVTELGNEVATVHRLLNVYCRIMTQLDSMIAHCKQE
ncbi:uncharacterized protein HD556DRAFT_1303537 [Suillus plorans]|uniref:Uncharacterized protein n=1 Tax=Suillus plorans TaxID=116603 RepID=A0A9P7J6J6_9AGAM|nr:uncharacterized protein HD556DRAFT_1303537 [Suillus plorans]KAG1805035.1 hypothetical protein HD556DRAFT_1303537 [Suillus plorans]